MTHERICIVLLMALFLISLLLNANQHGKPKEGKNNFWTSFITIIIEMTLIYFAGLFNNW